MINIDYGEGSYHQRIVLREALCAHRDTLLDRINAGSLAIKHLSMLDEILRDLEEEEDK